MRKAGNGGGAPEETTSLLCEAPSILVSPESTLQSLIGNGSVQDNVTDAELQSTEDQPNLEMAATAMADGNVDGALVCIEGAELQGEISPTVGLSDAPTSQLACVLESVNVEESYPRIAEINGEQVSVASEAEAIEAEQLMVDIKDNYEIGRAHV